MKTFRFVVGALALLPLALLANQLIFHPNIYDEYSLETLIYLAISVPILTLNFWAWSYPEIIEFYFFGKEKQPI